MKRALLLLALPVVLGCGSASGPSEPEETKDAATEARSEASSPEASTDGGPDVAEEPDAGPDDAPSDTIVDAGSCGMPPSDGATRCVLYALTTDGAIAPGQDGVPAGLSVAVECAAGQACAGCIMGGGPYVGVCVCWLAGGCDHD